MIEKDYMCVMCNKQHDSCIQFEYLTPCIILDCTYRNIDWSIFLHGGGVIHEVQNIYNVLFS